MRPIVSVIVAIFAANTLLTGRWLSGPKRGQHESASARELRKMTNPELFGTVIVEATAQVNVVGRVAVAVEMLVTTALSLPITIVSPTDGVTLKVMGAVVPPTVGTPGTKVDCVALEVACVIVDVPEGMVVTAGVSTLRST